MDLIRGWYRPMRVERFVYRHHRWFGAGIVVGSFFTLVALGIYAQQITALKAGNNHSIEGWLWESLILFVVLGNFFTLAAGVLILMRPSGLKGFESWANRSVDGSEVREALLSGLRRWPRVVALFLAVGGGFSLWILLRLLKRVKGF